MSDYAKTTVYLRVDDYRRLRAIAREQDRPAAELVREAVAEYAHRHSAAIIPSSLGVGQSGRGDLSERAEELLRGMANEG